MSDVSRRFSLVLTLCLLALPLRAAPRAEHVFIISLDGGKPAAIQQSQMPVLGRMVAEGAHTWTATTIFPSITLPSHTSMLTGVGPDKHHILWNSWVPERGMVTVPTVFSMAKQAGFSTAMFVGKEKFRHLLITNTVDAFGYGRGVEVMVAKTESGSSEVKREGTVMAGGVAEQAAAYIVEHKPGLCFIHFSDPDSAGHKYGWGSPQQLEAFGKCDAGLDVILKALSQAGIAEQSVVILSADHGGHAKTHGSKSPEDMEIPWVVWGKGVKRGFTISAPVNTCDTTATALWLLDVTCSTKLDGAPVISAFQ